MSFVLGEVTGLTGVAAGVIVTSAVVNATTGLAREQERREGNTVQVRASSHHDIDGLWGRSSFEGYGGHRGNARRDGGGSSRAPPSRPRPREMNYGEELASRVSSFGYSYGGARL